MHSQHFIWASVDSELICLVERYEGVRTYFKRGYRVSLWDLETGERVCEEIYTSHRLAAYAVHRFTDGGDGTGFYPNLKNLEVA